MPLYLSGYIRLLLGLFISFLSWQQQRQQQPPAIHYRSSFFSFFLSLSVQCCIGSPCVRVCVCLYLNSE